MASLCLLPINTTFHVTQNRRRQRSNIASRPRSSFLCQSQPPTEPTGGGSGSGGGGGSNRAWWVVMADKLHANVVNAGKAVQENLSPKQKGDWKDVTLMSFSFAVYVYISQKIVCTYCAWVSMINH